MTRRKSATCACLSALAHLPQPFGEDAHGQTRSPFWDNVICDIRLCAGWTDRICRDVQQWSFQLF